MNNYAFSIGYGRADITPTETVPLAGYGNSSQRMSGPIHDNLYVTCIAFSDKYDNTVLAFTTDLVRSVTHVTDRAKQAIFERTGIEPRYVMVSATHTHSAPDMLNDAEPSLRRYQEMYYERMADAAEQALADRKPAALFYGDTRTTRMNFIRNYYMDEEGNYLAHLDEPDNHLQMVKICREGGKDILLMNWQAHPCLSSRPRLRPNVSADFIGAVRTYLENLTGTHFAFFQGSCGNVNVRSKLPKEHITLEDSFYGELLGNYALAAMQNMVPIAGDKVAIADRIVPLICDHTEDHMVEKAKTVMEVWERTNDRAATEAVSKPLGINSPYHAVGILRRAVAGESKPALLAVVAVGELAFAFAPYEMYCDSGVFVKENSPYAHTFMATSANNHYDYQPTYKAFDYGCYERDERDFVRGTAEMLGDNFVDMLNKLK